MKISPLGELSDEQILQEFIKRFDCEGAVLIYFQDAAEFGFGGWKNASGRTWVNDLFKRVKKDVKLRGTHHEVTPGRSKWLNSEKVIQV